MIFKKIVYNPSLLSHVKKKIKKDIKETRKVNKIEKGVNIDIEQ